MDTHPVREERGIREVGCLVRDERECAPYERWGWIHTL